MPCIDQNGLSTGYIIHYSSQTDDHEMSIGNTTTFEITGLKPAMEYEVEVAAFNVEGRGPFTSTFLEVNTTGITMPYFREHYFTAETII